MVPLPPPAAGPSVDACAQDQDQDQDQDQEQDQEQEQEQQGAPMSDEDLAAALSAAGFAEADGAAAPETPGNAPDPSKSVAMLSSQWASDDQNEGCSRCTESFHHLNRRHHCRMCGRIFCQNCSSKRALIPPSSIVLVPRGGRKVGTDARREMRRADEVGFERNEDPDKMVTYAQSPGLAGPATVPWGPTSQLSSAREDVLLYGQGLEERAKLAREPLRVCGPCHTSLQPVQEELRLSNANAMRYNVIDPTDVRRLFNSPLAFTLGHEVRKAAYALNNLLPMPKRLGAVIPSRPIQRANPYQQALRAPETNLSAYSVHGAPGDEKVEQCRETCTGITGNLGDLDGVRIPARLVEKARGVAVVTCAKGGFGFAGVEFGTGLVVARLADGRGWSPPSAIGMGGFSWGGKCCPLSLLFCYGALSPYFFLSSLVGS